MDLQVNKKNGESFTFEEHGVIVKDFIVSSIPLISNYSRVEGSDRQLDNGVEYGSRTIRVPIHAQSYDLADFPLLRDKLFSLVTGKESFYIREMRRVKKLAYAFVDTNEPARMDPDTDNRFVGGKRYLVRLQNAFELQQMETAGEGELIFETTELPFAESIGTTQDIINDGINADLWGKGMGLDAVSGLKYRFTLLRSDLMSQQMVLPFQPIQVDPESIVDRRFKIYNAGNVPVHPFEHYLKITVFNTNENHGFFRLRNTSNGTELTVNDGLEEDETLVVDGPNVKINDLNALRRTTKEYITLEPGWNDFVMRGVDRATIEFDFRFYYK